jgi:hypothetical protein
VRAPLKDFAEKAPRRIRTTRPKIEDWRIRPFDQKTEWGDLTQRGYALATISGANQAIQYQPDWKNGFKVGLWADIDNRNIAARRSGRLTSGHSRRIRQLLAPDHESRSALPFVAGCGKPNKAMLDAIAATVNGNFPLDRQVQAPAQPALPGARLRRRRRVQVQGQGRGHGMPGMVERMQRAGQMDGASFASGASKPSCWSTRTT